MDNDKVLALQYDFGVTSTALAGKLVELIKAASEDNVHAQSVMALSAIGGLVHPSPERIGEAVNALGGTKNIKIQAMQLVLGVTCDGIASVLRQTTPGLASFLLVTALKLVYPEKSVGQILFELAAKSELLKAWPTSARQLTQAVEALSGQACSILPINHLNMVSTALLARDLDMRSRELAAAAMEPASFASLLSEIFTLLRKVESDRIVITGVHGVMWIASILTWLTPDQILVVHRKEVILGSPSAKLIIQVQKPVDDRISSPLDHKWTLSEWRKETSMKELIILTGQTDDVIIPKVNYRNMLLSFGGLEPEHMTILGQITTALIRLSVESIRLVCEKNGKKRHVPLLELCTAWFIEEYLSILKFYGWTVQELDEKNRFYENITAWIQSKPHQSVGFEGLKRYLNSLIKTSWQQAGLEVRQIPLSELLHLVEDSLSFSCLEEGAQSFLSFKSTFRSKISEFQLPLDSGRELSLESYRKMVISRIIPQYESDEGDLMVAGNGVVIWSKIITDLSCDKKASVALACMPGYIKRGLDRYSVVREKRDSFTNRHMRLSSPISPFEQDKYTGLRPLPGLITSEVRFISSNEGSTLCVWTEISFKNSTIPNSKPDSALTSAKNIPFMSNWSCFSWHKAMRGLFDAVYLNEKDRMTETGEEALARLIWLSLDSSTAGHSEFISGDSTASDSPGKYVACTQGDTLLRLLQLSQSYPWAHQVVCHGASIVKAVSVANKSSNQWVIVL
ncbi:hypothetical protein MMC10_009668 [Thelotrema lepadinum]|nr:hypothetical protein [Thelotrema lepadinum]